ncbi:MAG TPA: preprotein translocase subunit TatB [Firmicutes bacterium]|nr:preprotein translocase subunit TatB [Bacillota bacterium]
MCKLAPKTVDARGRSCPEPVLLTKKALQENPQGLQVLVQGSTARDNVKRFAENSGYRVTVDADGEDFVLTIDR